MPKYFHPDTDFYNKYKVAPPEATPHGTEEDIAARLKPVEMTNYRLEGNRLIAQTELGEVINFIPTDRILVGVDKNGLPILKRI